MGAMSYTNAVTHDTAFGGRSLPPHLSFPSWYIFLEGITAGVQSYRAWSCWGSMQAGDGWRLHVSREGSPPLFGSTPENTRGTLPEGHLEEINDVQAFSGS